MVSLEKELRKIVSKILILEESKVDDKVSRKNTKSWDSLAHLMLINEVEATFEVSFSDDDIVEINTVSDLKQKLKKNGVEI